MSPLNRRVTTLGAVLRAAAEGRLPAGWIYLQSKSVSSPDAPVYVAEAEESTDDAGRPVAALAAGFVVEGLEPAQLEDVAECCREFEDPPSDALLLESFLYYWRFDAFLPHPGAGEPPPWEEAQARLDREFYDGRGEERAATRCVAPECNKGRIRHSTLCRAHHFAMIHRRPCPFEDP